MVKAIVGACWGDEGKGKITDVLAEDSDIVVRFQGGSNAGHTIINEYGKFALHQLPSGVFRQNITNIIGNGVALSVENFLKEVQSVVERGVPTPKLLVSDRWTAWRSPAWPPSPLALPSPALRPSIPTSTPRLASRSAICSMIRIPLWSASTTCWG